MTFVLVVDDEEIARSTCNMALRHHGFKVWEARGVAQALEMVETVPFDAIVCDQHLPDGSGETVLKAAHEKCPQTPVIMLGGSPENDDEVVRDMAAAWMKKPVTIRELLEVLDVVLEPKETDGQSRQSHFLEQLIPGTDGAGQIYPVPLTLPERELVQGMLMHQLIELEDHHGPQAQKGRKVLEGILKRMKRVR